MKFRSPKSGSKFNCSHLLIAGSLRNGIQCKRQLFHCSRRRSLNAHDNDCLFAMFNVLSSGRSGWKEEFHNHWFSLPFDSFWWTSGCVFTVDVTVTSFLLIVVIRAAVVVDDCDSVLWGFLEDSPEHCFQHYQKPISLRLPVSIFLDCNFIEL